MNHVAPSVPPARPDPPPSSLPGAAWPEYVRGPHPADREPWIQDIQLAGRADSELEADAIAIRQACPVRTRCLTLSLRHWKIGRHGIRGGLVAAERTALRRRVPKAALDRSGSAIARILRLRYRQGVPVPAGARPCAFHEAAARLGRQPSRRPGT